MIGSDPIVPEASVVYMVQITWPDNETRPCVCQLCMVTRLPRKKMHIQIQLLALGAGL